jgi:3-oxoacyl-(acyl-carrier-protein) synthase
MASNLAFWQARLTACQTSVAAIETAIDAITVQGMESYMLDTGQTNQRVTALDIDKLNKMLDSALNRCATLEARISGSGNVIMRGGW